LQVKSNATNESGNGYKLIIELPIEDSHVIVLEQLRCKGFSNPRSIKKVLYVRSEDDGNEEITQSCVIMEGSSIKAIVLFDAFHASTSKVIANF
jgi:hypothetical protein